MTAETMGEPAMPAPGTRVIAVTTGVVMGSSDQQAVYLLDEATDIEMPLPVGCGQHLVVAECGHEDPVVLALLERIVQLEEQLLAAEVLTVMVARGARVGGGA